MVSSFQASVADKNAKQLELPEILPLKEYQYEWGQIYEDYRLLRPTCYHGGQAQSRQSIPPVPLKDGYQMLQLSVYSRIVKGRDSLQKHHNRLCANLPQEGSIRCLEVTEKQFATMKLLLGELKTQEKRVNSDQLLLF